MVFVLSNVICNISINAQGNTLTNIFNAFITFDKLHIYVHYHLVIFLSAIYTNQHDTTFYSPAGMYESRAGFA